MFSNPLARRRARRRPPEPVADPNSLLDLDDVIATVCRWGSGMPWVVAAPGTGALCVGDWFVIDCPVLGCTQPWFAIEALGDLENGPEVAVMLPSPLAHQGVAVGWAERAVDLDTCCSIAVVALATTLDELGALEKLLQVAYSAVFSHATW
jgi:hypothetical protein